MNPKRWQPNSPEAFRAWLEDIKPRVLHRSGRYQVFVPTPEQDKTIEDALRQAEAGAFQHSLSVDIQPRRHGKSTIFALICLWLFTSRQNYTIGLLGNSEQHTRRTQFNTLKKIIANTAALASAITEADIRQFEIRFPKLGNVIQIAASNTAASFGDRLNLLWVSDLHAAIDLEPFNALQASLLDSEGSLCLIDSNVDTTDGPVHQLQKEAETDPTIHCHHLWYRDIEDYLSRAPAWIDRTKAKRLQRTTLPADFARDILGKRMSAQNALFPHEIIEHCKQSFKIPVADIQTLARGRAYRVGGGLDRSKNVFPGLRGDSTVWTVVLKVASPEHGEPEIYILNQQKVAPNTSRNIKRLILKDHERYGLHNVVLENYEVGDLAPWLTDQRIPHELVSAHDTNQNASFPELYRIASEGRLHFSEDLKDLAAEMATFTYTQRPGGKFSFGHASRKFHDDHVYSLNWSVFSLRQAVLNVYTLGSFQCGNRTPRRHHCFLMGGNLELFCSRDCPAYQEVNAMFREYKQYQLDSELTLPEFYHEKVRHIGARISQAV